MIKYIYMAIIIIVGAVVILAGVGKVRFAENFAVDRPEYSEKQHKNSGIMIIVSGIVLIAIGVLMIFFFPEKKEMDQPIVVYCNYCGGDLLCDICGEEGELCEYSVFKTGDGAHYCSVHWSDCAERHKND